MMKALEKAWQLLSDKLLENIPDEMALIQLGGSTIKEGFKELSGAASNTQEFLEAGSSVTTSLKVIESKLLQVKDRFEGFALMGYELIQLGSNIGN